MKLFSKKNKKYIKGFSHIETLVSIVIFTFASLALISALMNFLNLNRVRNEISIASELAQHKIEEVKSNRKIKEYYKPEEVIATEDKSTLNIYKNIILKVETNAVGSISEDTLSQLTVIAYKCSKCNINSPSTLKLERVLAQYTTYISDN